MNSLKPTRFENKHVQLPHRTILAARPAFHRPEPLRGSLRSPRGQRRLLHIHQHVEPRAASRACVQLSQPQPRPAAATWKAPRGAAGWRKGPRGRGPSGPLWRCFGEVLLFLSPHPDTHIHPKACFYIFRKFSMTKISLDSETRPLLFFLLVLPSSTTQFSLGEARRFQDRKIF